MKKSIAFIPVISAMLAVQACAKGTGNPMVIIETNLGSMTLELYADKAPKTSENFLKLVDKKFFDGVIFHRVIKDFMIQGGDPTGTGRGGPGYMIPDEFGKGLQHSGPGILSMANSGPNTGGSQFFITLKATPWLDGRHAIFGHIVEGLDVLERIGGVPTGPGDKPADPVTMVKVYRKAASPSKKPRKRRAKRK